MCSTISLLSEHLQKDFWRWNEEQLSHSEAESGILIHDTGHSESIIAEFL
jgi:hypothetical protein